MGLHYFSNLDVIAATVGKQEKPPKILLEI